MTYHTHPQYLALLAAVRANPDDDLTRLVVADWLDENGHGERASIIRSQVGVLVNQGMSYWSSGGGMTFDESAKFPYGGDVTRRVLYAIWPGIEDVKRSSDYRQYRSVNFRGGFIGQFRCRFAEWVEHADRILPESVGLTVRLTTNPSTVGHHVTADLSAGITFVGDQLNVRIKFPSGPGDSLDLSQRVMWLYFLNQRWPDVAKWELPEPTVNLDATRRTLDSWMGPFNHI